MNQKLITLSTVLVFNLLVFTGCRKEELNTTQDNATSEDMLSTDKFWSECRLTRLGYTTIDFYHQFKYNNKGLAREWRVHYEDGTEDIYKLEYDQLNRLKKATDYYDGALFNTIRFFYTGNKVTKEIWYTPAGDIDFETYNTYNWLGQLVKRENTNGAKTIFSPTIIGNTPLFKLYFDDELYMVGEYTYHQPNKNPWRAIPGVDYGFPYIALDFTNWWESSEKITIYEDGIPTVIYAYDPAQTVMSFGQQHSLSSVFNYDYVNELDETYVFDYENCGRGQHHDPGNSSKTIKPSGHSMQSHLLSEICKTLRNGAKANAVKEKFRQLKKLAGK
ncbi:MAG: hypothetical protein ABI741_03575 [Ferruginibacter sp.]